MLFYQFFREALLLPLVGPAAAVALLLATGPRRWRITPSLLAALLLLLPTFLLTQCLLTVASWCLTPLAEATATPPCAPWYVELLLAPVCYLYLRALTANPLGSRGAWRRLLPGFGQIALFAGVAVLNLGYRHGVTATRFGSPSAAAELLRHLLSPLALGCYVLLLLYGLQTWETHRQHQPARRAAGERRSGGGSQRTLLFLLLLGFGLGLSFVALDAWFGPFAYSEIGYAFGVRCGLVFGLAVVGLQAGSAGVQPARLPLVATSLADWRGPQPFLPASRPGPSLVSRAQPAASSATQPATLPAELLPWRTKLLALMQTEQPWLQPELTLAELAQRLRTTPGLLSKVINTGCGQHFNDFVNAYRVAEARRKLADPRYAHYSLVGIALESGFNSKSTFNRVFKKLTGQAPSELARPNLGS